MSDYWMGLPGFSKFSVQENHLEHLIRMLVPELYHQISDSAEPRRGPGTYISNKHPFPIIPWLMEEEYTKLP